MRRSTAKRYSFWLTAALAGAVFGLTAGARADTPACDEIVQDPTIATCTCICEAGSLFAGCQGLAEGTAAATPNQCPDMLQGRRVLSRGDAVLVASPRFSSSNNTRPLTMLYGTENDPNNTGLGIVNGTPVETQSPDVPCRMEDGVPFPDQTRLARLFDLPYDMLVHLRPMTDSSQVKPDCFAVSSTTHNLVFAINSPNDGAPTVPDLTFQSNPTWVYLAIDDFDYDSFDDIVSINVDSIQVRTAVDTVDPTKGIVEKGVARTVLPSGALAAPINEPTTGDFNGDGLKDVAWIGGNFPNKSGTLSVFFATVCPGDIADTICAGAERFEIILDPASKLFPGVSGATSTIVLDNATLTPTSCGVVQTPVEATFGNQDSLRAGAIAVGNFEDNGFNPRGAPIDELVITYVSGTTSDRGSSDQCSVDLQYWSFAAPEQSARIWAKQRGDTIAGLFPQVNAPDENANVIFSLYAQSAYLDWYGAVEQAVLGVTGGSKAIGGLESAGDTFWFPITVSVKGTGNQAQISACTAATKADLNYHVAWGVAAGRFSTSTTVNPKNPSACNDFADAAPGDCPYNPQIAMLVAKDQANGGGSGDPSIRLYTVRASDPGGSGPKCANDQSVEGFLPIAGSTVGIGSYHSVPVATLRGGNQLHTGDAFGDSMRVGSPTLTPITPHTQPQIVIQAPPSLVDYIQPNSADSPSPAIVNFTRAPNNYQAQVEFDTTSSDTASTQKIHSFSASFTENVGAEVKLGVPKAEGIDETEKDSWSQFNESTNSEQLGTYSTTRLQTGGAIGVDDQVWWTQNTLNVFHFPVIGKTTCPASLTCDPSDPNTIGCTPAASSVDLTCSASGEGCDCVSDGASASLCPAFPTDVDARSCAEDGNNVCCSLLQQQLNVSFSGPEEVTRSSSPGASIEWYQPKHEPAQILSYPSSTLLLEARTPGAQALATLAAFTTGTNNTSESMSWTCGTTSNVTTGTTTRHSFETQFSITAGTPNLAQKTDGANLSFGFDYQGSGSISTLNSYSVGQTASSSVKLYLEGAGFKNVAQYEYRVEGVVLGTEKPISVLDNPDLKVCPNDNPDCSTVDEVQADCTTTGPLTVAFAADPATTDSGLWWSSTSPYRSDIDVALNNPSRWRRVSTSDVANPSLQCRGPANVLICYTSNQPPAATDAASVWDALFYNMKGLLVTTGDSTGPQRDTAVVGDEIFLQTWVYNYSLKAMDAGTNVFARFYRQQLDVNDDNGALSVVSYATDADGKPLPAVPIGPTGLGDSDLIPVVSPEDGSATIPPFNTTADPSRDNISVATTSYTAATDDACEYDNGVQSCNGAYYAYWVTVWAEDASGDVIAELPGHGLNISNRGGFDPSTAYAFITDVPKETVTFNNAASSFSNNVGMFKKVFTILPQGSTDAFAASAPGELTLQQVSLVPERARLLEPVVVSAQVVSPAAAQTGATVVFYHGGESFDAEWLPHVRADDSHFVRVPFTPEACGTHEIFLEVTGGVRTLGDAVSLLLDVDMDLEAAVDFLTAETQALTLSFPGKAGAAHKKILLRALARAEQAFDRDRLDKGRLHLDRYRHHVETLERQGRIDPDKAYLLIGHASEVIGCIEAI
jgi:hypothetical protein